MIDTIVMASHCTILVLGHLPSEDNLNGLRSRDLDINAERAGRWLGDVSGASPLLRCFGQTVDASYCPALVRHQHSARLIANLLGIAPPVPDARLNNIDYGAYQGRPLAETPSLHRPEDAFEDGESWIDVARRWHSFFDEVLARHVGELVLLPGQSGASRRMLEHICDGVPLATVLSWPVADVPYFSSNSDDLGASVVWRYRPGAHSCACRNRV